MIAFDKDRVKELLTADFVFDLLIDFGGEPQRTGAGIISKTICHNHPEDTASRKLYYYENTKLFHCYTGCEESTFDLFQLIIKIAEIQWHQTYELNDAIRWISNKLGFTGEYTKKENDNGLEDWKYLTYYDKIKELPQSTSKQEIVLKEYEKDILNRLNYEVKITPWLE